MKKFLILISIILSSCGGEKKEKGPQFLLNRAQGFKITKYSISRDYNWIPVSGSAIFHTSMDFESEEGSIYWDYENYSDQFGNCSGNVSGTVTPMSVGELGETSIAETGGYDVNSPYVPETAGVSSTENLRTLGAKMTVTNFNVTACPFSTFAENGYGIYFYNNGDLVIIDYYRGIDYLLKPN